jgi:hypothetical protein
VLDGRRLGDADAKGVLCRPVWAYRFWRAGHDPAVRRCQVEHAAARVDVFYRPPRARLGGRPLSDFVTSEYGVALLLDEHVNRPGHVPGTLAAALDGLPARGRDPAAWTDEDEAALLGRYVAARNATGMTSPQERAATIGRAVAAGWLSPRRGSFASPAPPLVASLRPTPATAT